MVQRGVEPEVWALALLGLFVIRPLAIGASLAGQKLMASTAAFLGWFGPRGLATVVFMLVAFRGLDGVRPQLLDVVVLTVALSAVLHGLTATPLSSWIGRRIESRRHESMPEVGEGYEHPARAITPPIPD